MKEENKQITSVLETEYLKYLMSFSFDDDTPICIVGPDRSNNKDKLRVYAYGGQVAAFPLAQAQVSLADTNYVEYVKNVDDKNYLKDTLDNKNVGEIFEDRYWKIVLEAAKSKFTNNKGVKGNVAERLIETKLVKKSTNSTSENHFIVCDMEFSLWQYRDETTGKKHTPRFDLVLINNKRNDKKIEIRFVELKCCESTCKGSTGINNHVIDMLNVVDDKLSKINKKDSRTEQIREIVRRYNILCNRGIINKGKTITKETLKESSNFILTAGVLYVPDGSAPIYDKEQFKCICRNKLSEGLINDKRLYFQFANTVPDVNFDNMKTWDEFTKE